MEDLNYRNMVCTLGAWHSKFQPLELKLTWSHFLINKIYTVNVIILFKDYSVVILFLYAESEKENTDNYGIEFFKNCYTDVFQYC